MDEARLWAELAALRAEMEGLRLAVAEGKTPPRRRNSGALLAAIFGRVGDRVFVAVDLLEFCEAAGAVDLREAIVAAVGSLNARRLGKRLAEAEGEALDGYRLRRVETTRSGIVWQVVRQE